MKNVIDFVKHRFENAQIFDNDDGDAIIPINYTIEPDSKIIFIVGSNASGKSVVGKVIEFSANDENLTKRSCSMRNRTSGLFGQRLIFGDEADSSTGMNSVQSAIMGIKSTVDEENSILILDEPDLGLADEYSAALGQYIAESVNEHYSKIGLFVVITHSRTLIKYAIESLKKPYSSVYVGSLDKNFDDWLNEKFKPATIDELLGLKNKNHETWKRIQNMNSEK